MIGRFLAFAAMALTAAPGAAAPRKPVRAAARADWTRTVVRLPDGAYRLGNPAATVKLIEYLSLTCPHCAHFALEGMPVLKRDYIAKGLVSIEFKHAVRDGFDMAASLLARCGGAPRYLAEIDTIFRDQPNWFARAQTFTPPADVSTDALPAAFAKGVGLDTLVIAGGLPAPRAAACLADKAEQHRLIAMRNEAFETRKIEGTPGFVLNGTLTPAFGWDQLKPLIDAALR